MPRNGSGGREEEFAERRSRALHLLQNTSAAFLKPLIHALGALEQATIHGGCGFIDLAGDRTRGGAQMAIKTLGRFADAIFHLSRALAHDRIEAVGRFVELLIDEVGLIGDHPKEAARRLLDLRTNLV